MGSCPVQRIVSRALYREEYERSLVECMGGPQHQQEGEGEGEGEPAVSQDLRAMLGLHRAHLKAVERHKPLSDLVDKLRGLRSASEAQQSAALT